MGKKNKNKSGKAKSTAPDWQLASTRPNKLFSENTGPYETVGTEERAEGAADKAKAPAAEAVARERTPSDLHEHVGYGDGSSSSKSKRSSGRSRSRTPDSQQSGSAPKAVGLQVTMSLKELTELQTELKRLRVEAKQLGRRKYRDAAEPQQQTLAGTAKSDTSMDVDDPELRQEQETLWQPASSGRKVRQPPSRRPSSASGGSVPSLLGETDSSGSTSGPQSDSSDSLPDSGTKHMVDDRVPRGKGYTARLRRKRNLNKLAWQVADHFT